MTSPRIIESSARKRAVWRIARLPLFAALAALSGAAVLSIVTTGDRPKQTAPPDPVAVAETGIDLARATLMDAPDATNPDAVPAQTVQVSYHAGVTYFGTFDPARESWTLHATSVVLSDVPGGAIGSRSASSQLRLTASEGSDERSSGNPLHFATH